MIANVTSILTVLLLFALLTFTVFDLKIDIKYVDVSYERNKAAALNSILRDILQ